MWTWLGIPGTVTKRSGTHVELGRAIAAGGVVGIGRIDESRS
jgi:hypothetical protein